MDPLDKEKLERTLALAQENNVMLKKIRSAQKTAQMFKAMYWVIIIVITIAGYAALRPYLDTVKSLSGSARSDSGTNMQNLQELQALLKDLNNK